MDEIDLKEVVLGERKFLHDMSNKLLIAQGMSTFVTRKLSKGTEAEEKDLERCEKLMVSMKEMTDLIVKRREILHEISHKLGI